MSMKDSCVNFCQEVIFLSHICNKCELVHSHDEVTRSCFSTTHIFSDILWNILTVLGNTSKPQFASNAINHDAEHHWSKKKTANTTFTFNLTCYAFLELHNTFFRHIEKLHFYLHIKTIHPSFIICYYFHKVLIFVSMISCENVINRSICCIHLLFLELWSEYTISWTWIWCQEVSTILKWLRTIWIISSCTDQCKLVSAFHAFCKHFI